MALILQWIDLVWLALALCVARKDQRAWVAGFFIASMVMMRLLVELMQSIGYPYGIIGLMATPIHTRGLIFYSAVYLIYILFFHFSPNAKGTLLMAASIAFFFAAFFATAFLMVL